MLYDAVSHTYKSNIIQLSPAKRFHFATRLNLRTGDPWAAEQLDSLKDWFFRGDEETPERRLNHIGLTQPDLTHLNAATERAPILARHPWIFGYELQLFQVLHAKIQYDTDLRPLLQDPVPHIKEHIDELVTDPTILAILSTYIIDVYYLYYRIILEQEVPLISLDLLHEALSLEVNPASKPLLNVYLLTHCIIGETDFYARDIPRERRTYYDSLAELLEKTAHDTWGNLSLDNKLEVALCLLLTDTASPLVTKAIKESDDHYDASQGFIVDPKVPHKNDLEWAEHRNILYLMASSFLKN